MSRTDQLIEFLLPNDISIFHQSDRLMSRLWSKFYGHFFSDDILSQGHLMVVSVPCDIRKDSFKDTFFEINKFPKKKHTYQLTVNV